MNSGLKFSALLFITVFSLRSLAGPQKGKYFDHAIFVVFENTNYSAAIQQPFFKKLADQGAHFSNFSSITHPSQGNYVALTSGALNGVKGDHSIDLNVTNVADLLEAKGLSWKVYAEDYPGNCFTGEAVGNYARKHNPFISYLDIQKNPARCSQIVNAIEFDQDIKSGHLPDYVFYIPNETHDGHDTGVTYADNWYSQTFSKYFEDAQFMQNTVFISTFDESGASLTNQIYTSIVGAGVRPGVVSLSVNLYSLLNLVEDNWNLGHLGKQDSTATPIPNIWQ